MSRETGIGGRQVTQWELLQGKTGQGLKKQAFGSDILVSMATFLFPFRHSSIAYLALVKFDPALLGLPWCLELNLGGWDTPNRSDHSFLQSSWHELSIF